MSESLDLVRLRDVYITSYLQALDCPRALSVWLLYVSKEHKQLADLEFDPRNYPDKIRARDSLAATKFLSKAVFLETGNDLKEKAMEKFFEAEAVCKETNQAIRRNRFKNPATSAILTSMAFKISNVLGEFPADEFVDACNWGPGSTTLLRRAEATHPKKFSVERKITAKAYDFVKPWFHVAYPLWDITFEIDGFSKIVTVPKNAKTDRLIAIEPGINLWFQKGIGLLIRKRLKRNGIDLNDQSINQERARIGSKFNQLATVDFSMASDTISYDLVEQLLPSNWFTVMNNFRSSSALVGKNIHHFAKFSSMGNGFTFELESLLFFSLAVAVCDYLGLDRSGISVYGDDVVLPSQACDLFYSVSADLGFSVNKSKSYQTGSYRESCGAHYWDGESIKPVFLKETFNGLQSVIRAANTLRDYARDRLNSGCDARLRAPWLLLIQYLGDKCPRVPYGYGDLGIAENFSETERYRTAAKHGYEGYYVSVYAVQAQALMVYDKGLLLSKLKAMGYRNKPVNYLTDELTAGSGGNSVPLPGRVRYVRKRILIPQWVDIGAWV